jgi:hypothetical protein
VRFVALTPADDGDDAGDGCGLALNSGRTP